MVELAVTLIVLYILFRVVATLVCYFKGWS